MTKDIWLVSDTHFSHDNIIKYCDRPFNNSLEMNEFMLDAWNERVKPGDIVYHLGDVLMGGEVGKEWFKTNWPKFNGKKRLVVGNHDNIKWVCQGGFFQKVLTWRVWDSKPMIFSHVPIQRNSLFDRGKEPVRINVHGHIHNNHVTLENGEKDPMYKCVCVEHTNYAPINIEEIEVNI